MSASGSVTGIHFDVQSGNLTKFTVGRQLGSSTVRLPDPAFGTLGTIQAATGCRVTVLGRDDRDRRVGRGRGRPPASPLLLGGIVGNITAYQNGGTAAAIGKLTARGDLSTSTINAEGAGSGS